MDQNHPANRPNNYDPNYEERRMPFSQMSARSSSERTPIDASAPTPDYADPSAQEGPDTENNSERAMSL